MIFTEEQLRSWTKPLSETEETRVQHSVDMIKRAVKENPNLSNLDIEIFTQGSYANNTNVKADSDVDICVMCKSTFFGLYPEGYSASYYGYVNSDYHFDEYRREVFKAMCDKFGNDNVVDGNKSIKIKSNTYRVQADVVPAFLLKDYAAIGSLDKNVFVEGIKFISKKEKVVINYPKLHIKNGVEKNKDTNKRYKQLVRIMKNMKNDMVEAGSVNGDKISSFLVECLVWNVPNEIIVKSSTFSEMVKRSVLWLIVSIKGGHHHEWKEVSGQLDLFNEDRKWKAQDALVFLESI